MSEARASSPDEISAGERDTFLATKLVIPRTRADLLPRSRLIDMLDEGLARPVLLVCTPAGFGKTTLLADWANKAKAPVGWLSLDPEDNDPVRFCRYVIAALHRACGDLGDRLDSLFSGPGPASSQGAVGALLNELEGRNDQLVLVLDDYHVIESPAIHDGMALLLSHLPPQLRILITSRSDPPLPLPRLRANDRLAEVRASDLRFTREESAAFLREVWGLDLPSDVVAALETRTEGWAVGLQLAALSLRERPDPGAFLEAFTGTHRFVLDYLSEEVLERQPERVRTFLLQTSILQRLTAPLCNAVTGGSDGQDILEELERANLFLVPLDEQRRWYRFHHLFADLLQARLLASSEDAVIRELNRRASDWCEEHALVDDAIRYALAAGDTGSAKRVVEEHVTATLRRGEGAIVERWLSALPDEVVRSRPLLCFARALLDLHIGRLESVESLLDHAERMLALRGETRQFDVPTAGGMVSEVPAMALLRAELAEARGNAEGVAEQARLALTHMSEEEAGPRFLARWFLVLADWMRGGVVEAESEFAAMLAEGKATTDPHPLMTSCWMLGRVQRSRGELSAALRTYREGLRFSTAGGRLSSFHAAEAHVGIAQALYERDELDKAVEHVTEGIELSRQVVEYRLPAVGLTSLAWIRRAMGDRDGAVEAMNEAWSMEPSTGIAGMVNPVPAERARFLLAQEKIAEAERWVEEQGLKDDDEVTYPWERRYLVLVRVLLARGEPVHALRLLEHLETPAKSQGRNESLIQIRALRSVALQSAGDHPGALTVLADALSLARPEGYVRVFADEGPVMAALLRSLIGARQRGSVKQVSRAAREHVNRIIRAFVPAAGHTLGPAEKGGLIEPLTDRELEVLRLVVVGKRNREIAQELVVTLETVKKHMSNIFGKLGATSRTNAVAQARELGLIS
jgi:LuxR family maltose regulon positive regulatory protein